MRGKVTEDKIPSLFSIMGDVMENAKLDHQQRFLEMVKEMKAGREAGVINSGHSYAARKLGSKFSYLGHLSEQTGGVSSIAHLVVLLHQAESDWESVLRRLVRIRDAIYIVQRTDQEQTGNDDCKPSVVINLTGSPSVLNKTKVATQDFLQRIPIESSVTGKRGFTLKDWLQDGSFTTTSGSADLIEDEGYVIPSQVNYVVSTGQLLSADVPLRGDLNTSSEGEIVPSQDVKLGSFGVVSKYISTSYLWDHVRVLGGAYGGFCGFGATSGRFTFSSYRDPNVFNTMQTYKNSVNFLESSLSTNSTVTADGEGDAVSSDDRDHDRQNGLPALSNEVILQYIIGSMGDLDSPSSPDQKGYTSMSEYLRGETVAHKQLFRDEILSTDINDFEVFRRKLQDMIEANKCHTVVFGSESALSNANVEITALSGDESSVSSKKLLKLSAAIPPSTKN